MNEVTEERATQAAKDRAAELGVELSTVAGTGKDGRITVGDVEAAAGVTEEPTSEEAVAEEPVDDSGRTWGDGYLVWQRTAQITSGPFPTEEDAEAAIARAKSYSLQADADEFDIVAVKV